MSTSKDRRASAPTAQGSHSGTRRVPYERMPYPIGLCWVTAHRAQQTLTVYKSAETAVRVMFSMVLADVLDLDWPDDATRKLCDGPDPKRGLDKLSFGTRVDLLRTVVKLHAGATGRVLPDLRRWWSRAAESIGAIVTERNEEGHDGALVEESPDEAKARLAEFLRASLWLQQVQLVHVESASRSRGRYSGAMVRLQGAAPYHGLDHEVRAAWRAEFEPGWVYLGNAEGTEWTLNPFLSARDRAVAVLDAIDRSGRLEFIDPGSKRGETREQTDGVPVPGNRWKLAPWRKFLESRQATARSREWRFREDDPDPLLLLETPTDPTLQPDAVVGDYRLVQLLGEGASAAVWEAVELASGTTWALKVLKPEIADSAVESGRFANEFVTLRRLHALGCRRLLGPVEKITIDVGDVPRIMLRMPLLAGSLAQRAREMREAGEAPDVPTVARWGVQGLEALVDVHKHIQAHRDIKPSNFLVDGNGELVLADFGIVRDESRPKQWTRTGDTLGSDPYMAPEQRNNASAATGKADVYGLAATLHELLSGGWSPVPGKGLEGELGALIHEMGRADPDRRPDATQALERMRAIADRGVVDAAPGRVATVAAKDGASEEWAEAYWWHARTGVERIRKLDGLRLEALALKLAVTADAMATVRGGFRRNAEDFVELLREAAEGGAIGDEDAATLEDARRMYCISRQEAAELATRHWEHARAAGGDTRAVSGWIATALAASAAAREEAARVERGKRSKTEAEPRVTTEAEAAVTAEVEARAKEETPATWSSAVTATTSRWWAGARAKAETLATTAKVQAAEVGAWAKTEAEVRAKASAETIAKTEAETRAKTETLATAARVQAETEERARAGEEEDHQNRFNALVLGFVLGYLRLECWNPATESGLLGNSLSIVETEAKPLGVLVDAQDANLLYGVTDRHALFSPDASSTRAQWDQLHQRINDDDQLGRGHELLADFREILRLSREWNPVAIPWMRRLEVLIGPHSPSPSQRTLHEDSQFFGPLRLATCDGVDETLERIYIPSLRVGYARTILEMCSLSFRPRPERSMIVAVDAGGRELFQIDVPAVTPGPDMLFLGAGTIRRTENLAVGEAPGKIDLLRSDGLLATMNPILQSLGIMDGGLPNNERIQALPVFYPDVLRIPARLMRSSSVSYSSTVERLLLQGVSLPDPATLGDNAAILPVATANGEQKRTVYLEAFAGHDVGDLRSIGYLLWLYFDGQAELHNKQAPLRCSANLDALSTTTEDRPLAPAPNVVKIVTDPRFQEDVRAQLKRRLATFQRFVGSYRQADVGNPGGVLARRSVEALSAWVFELRAADGRAVALPTIGARAAPAVPLALGGELKLPLYLDKYREVS